MNAHNAVAQSARGDQSAGVPHALAHSTKDNVAVVVVTEDNSSFTVTAQDDIPIGHKLALTDLSEGDTVIKYGQDVGRMVGPAGKGRHVHTHNMKTKRW